MFKIIIKNNNKTTTTVQKNIFVLLFGRAYLPIVCRAKDEFQIINKTKMSSIAYLAQANFLTTRKTYNEYKKRKEFNGPMVTPKRTQPTLIVGNSDGILK